MRRNLIDAQAALGFVNQQAAYIEPQVNMMVYPDIIYQNIIPVDNAANPFVKTVVYFSADQFGQARWINGNSDDIPLAGTERNRHETPVHTAGIGYGFGWEEINDAMMYGVNLTAEDAMAARRAYEEMCQTIALQGDTVKGFNGLLNYPGVTVVALPNGSWTGDGTTEDEILEDVNSLLLGVPQATLFTTVADTLLMSPERLNLLATIRLGDTGTTVLSFLRQNNSYTAMTGQPLTIRGIQQLSTAGSGNTQRMIAYRRSPDVLKLHIPMPHRFLPAFQDGPLHWVVPGVFRMGGLDIRRPAEVRFGDGL